MKPMTHSVSSEGLVATGSWPHKAPEPPSKRHELQVVAAVRRALRSTGYPHLRRLQVSMIDDEIVLRGKVPTFFMFQMAQATVMSVAFDKKLRNELQVHRR
jgi:osmotically-inducible protein OsmY